MCGPLCLLLCDCSSDLPNCKACTSDILVGGVFFFSGELFDFVCLGFFKVIKYIGSAFDS